MRSRFGCWVDRLKAGCTLRTAGRQHRAPTGVPDVETDREVGCRYPLTSLLWPLDQEDGAPVDQLVEAGIQPFLWRVQAVEVQVMDANIAGGIAFHQRIGGASDASALPHRLEQALHERGLSSPQTARQGDNPAWFGRARDLSSEAPRRQIVVE